MSPADPEVYERLDAATLTTTLLNPEAGDDAHHAALTALSHRGPMERNPRLVQILGAILKNPTRWPPAVPEKIIDLLATDPDPEATLAMLEVLPILLGQEHAPGTTAALSTVRGYFYQALATRERDEDIEVWSEFVPKLNARMLINIALDTQAGPLIAALDPLELINRRPEPERTNALFSVISGACRRGGITDEIRSVWEMFKLGVHRQAYQDGVETLVEHWERAKQSGHTQHMRGLEAVLAVMDKRPRSTTEKLTGKRPWVS